MKDLTPEHLRCTPVSPMCPAVYELGDGYLLIVGKTANEAARNLNIPVGDDEAAIEVTRDMLANVKP